MVLKARAILINYFSNKNIRTRLTQIADKSCGNCFKRPRKWFKRESRRSDHKTLNDANINFPVRRKAWKPEKGSRERMILESIFQIAKALTLRLKWHSISIIYHYRDARRSDI